MPPLKYTAAELSSLAPEERSALEAAEGTDADVLTEIAGDEAAAAPAAEAAAAATAAVAPAEGQAAAAAPAASAPAAAAAAEDSAAPAAAAPAAGPTPAPSPNAVVYRANVGDMGKDIQAQKDAIKSARGEKRSALMKLNDGEIDADEYARIEDGADAKIDAANDKIMEFSRAVTRAEVSVELTAQQQQNAWKTMLTGFVKEASDAGLNITGDEKLRAEFNGLLKGFATEAESRGMSDDEGMSASAFALEQAKIMMGMRHGKAFGKQVPAAAPAAGAAPAAAATPAAAAAVRPVIPPTLGLMPAAAAAPISDDLMSKVASLEGEELEMFIANLPKDQAQRLMAGAQ